MQEREKAEFRQKLVLSYLKDHRFDYSYEELSGEMGLSYSVLIDLINKMISDGLVEIRENCLTMTFKGRMMLQNSEMELYSTINEPGIIDEFRQKSWPVDKVFVPLDFK